MDNGCWLRSLDPSEQVTDVLRLMRATNWLVHHEPSPAASGVKTAFFEVKDRLMRTFHTSLSKPGKIAYELIPFLKRCTPCKRKADALYGADPRRTWEHHLSALPPCPDDAELPDRTLVSQTIFWAGCDFEFHVPAATAATWGLALSTLARRSWIPNADWTAESPDVGELSAESGLATLREVVPMVPDLLDRALRRLAPATVFAPEHVLSGPPPAGTPYAFVSYASADKEAVLREIDRFAVLGARIWFDQHLAAGANWIEQLGQAIRSAAVVLLFLSPRSVESSMVGKEVLYAVSLGKPVIVIQLQPTTLSPGKQLLLGDLQWVLRDRLSEPAYRDAVCAALAANAAM